MAHALPEPLRVTSEAQAAGLTEQRRLCGRRDTKRSDWRGVRAAAITSGIQDSGISSGPASGMTGDREDDLAGGKGPERSGGIAPNISSCGGLVRAQREGKRDRNPGARERTAFLAQPATPVKLRPPLRSHAVRCST